LIYLTEVVWQDKPEWINKAKTMVQAVWTNHYAHLRTSSRESDHDSPLAKKPRFYDPFEANSRSLQASQSIAVICDEYEILQRDKEITDAEVRSH
jgi:hypothetical protein